jgi:hypothetical protein
MGPMYFFVFCRPYTSSPQPSRQYLAPICHLLTNTVCRSGLAYSYDWRGFVGATKKTSVDMLEFNSSIVGGSAPAIATAAL